MVSHLIELSVQRPSWRRGSVDYSKGGATAPAKCHEAVSSPFKSTSYYEVKATPDQVVNGTTLTVDLAGASGLFKIGINSELNLICNNIEIYNFRGCFRSPNPVEVGNGVRRSVGCQQGPFKTGLLVNGKDTADGFHISQIEKNPAGFFANTHSRLAVPGAVRGQLAQMVHDDGLKILL
ncbi:hypothetical protein E4T52_16939 [Aureobasidium sp. EXF-3400]|nr:hypothetical protein E4T51_16184 [Aureobasidium sp. EXF-12344]KAI4767952.1 hypothetical protein E4T52_16939 [Aureobasidium sp. EXF-3400]